ncbi:hypothetical protein ABT288_45350 [Streptomyces sp. NPDC001093]|uniref:hypothetical protein n=1 Tax=Streptomyces sp. NPDC001093 TaxID=3154376 RepID=UPI00332573C1
MPGLTACAVLAGATSLPVVGEWIADAPAHVLEAIGLRPDLVMPQRDLRAESTMRRLLKQKTSQSSMPPTGGLSVAAFHTVWNGQSAVTYHPGRPDAAVRAGTSANTW